jgi:hypothetical protein
LRRSGYCDSWLHGESTGRYKLPLTVHLKRTIARVRSCAIGQKHLEKARALNGDILTVACLLEVALREDPLGSDRPYTSTNLQT